MSNTSKKKLTNLVYRMSQSVKGLTLAHAFKLLKSNGITLRIDELDGRKYPKSVGEKEISRINVQIEAGCVKRCWVG